MKAVMIDVSEALMLELFGLRNKGISIHNIRRDPLFAGRINIVLTGDSLPEVQEGKRYPEAIIEGMPDKSEIKLLPVIK